MHLHLSLIAILAFGWLVGPDEPREDPCKKEREKLQGAWVLEISKEGKGLIPTGVELVIKGEKWVGNGKNYHWSPAGDSLPEETTGSFKIDPAKKPKTVDVTKDKKMGDLFPELFAELSGIYELEGDLLKMCFGFGEPRPTEFDTKRADVGQLPTHVLVTWKREKRVLGSAKERATLKGHAGVDGIRYSGDSNTLASFSADGTNEKRRAVAKVWDVAAQKVVTSFEGEKEEEIQPCITSDGKTLVMFGYIKRSQIISLRDARNGDERAAFKLGNADFFSAALTPDGRYLAAGGRDGEDYKEMWKVWEVKSGKELHSWGGRRKRQGVVEIAITADGKCVVWGMSSNLGENGHLGLMVLDGDEPREVGLQIPSRNFQRTRVQSLRLAADGKTLAVAFDFESRREEPRGGEVVIYGLPSGKPCPLTLKSKTPLRSIAISPDGKTLATGLNAEVSFWDVDTGRERCAIRHAVDIRAMEFSPDGKMLAVATEREVKVWDLPDLPVRD